MSSVAISARIQLHADSWSAYLDAAKGIIAPTREETGCVHYSFAKDIQEPNVVWISEEWACEEDLVAHLSSSHITDFLATTSELKIEDMVVKKYTVSAVGGL